MKLIYVAGPFRASNSWDMEQNIRRAEALSLEVWKRGVACICPHANTRFYQGAAHDDLWLEGDLEILSRCDAVLLVEGWKFSSGTREEVRFASEKDIPILYSFQEFEEWVEAGE